MAERKKSFATKKGHEKLQSDSVTEKADAVSADDSQGNESGENWVKNMFRMLHLDSHFVFFDEIYKDFDAEATAQTFADLGFQMVSYMAFDGPSYYPTKMSKIHPGLTRDFVGEMTTALKKRGIRCVTYVSFGSMAFDDEKLEQVGIRRLKEILELYDVDGFFLDGPTQSYQKGNYGELCRSLYEKEVGGEFPTDDDHPRAYAFRKWANRRMEAALDKVHAALAEIKPEIAIINNGAWMLRYPVTPPSYVKLIQWDVATPAKDGVYACSFSMESRYLSTLPDFPFSTHNVRGRDWMEFSLREPEAFMHESAIMLAAGGRPYLSDNPYPSGNPEPAIMGIYSEVNKRTRELEPYLIDCKPVKDIAVLHSADSVWSKAPFRPVTGWMPSPAYGSVAGAHKALVEGNVQMLIPNSEVLLDTIDEYGAVVLADQRILSEAQCEAIRQFVHNGGALIATGETGTRDAEDNERLANFALSDVLGVDFLETSDTSLGYLRTVKNEEYGILAAHIPAVGSYVRVKTTTAETLLELVGPYEGIKTGNPPPAETAEGPGVTINSYGKGKAIYCAAKLFDAYNTMNMPVLRKLGLWMLGLAYPNNSRTIVLEDAPINVEVFYNQRGNERFIHLINYSADRREAHPSSIQDFLTIHGIGIRVRFSEKPARITAVPEEREIAFTYADGWASFDADPLYIHSVYRIEL